MCVSNREHSVSCPFIEASLRVSVTCPYTQEPWIVQTNASLTSGGPILPAVLGEVSCVSLRILSVNPWLYILHSPSFSSPGASSISSLQKIKMHPCHFRRESARVSSMFHHSASLYFITLYQCLLRHGSVHTHKHCFADGVGSVLCFCHCIIWEANVPGFAFSPLKIYYAANKDDQILSPHLKFTIMGENCSLVGVLVGEDTAWLSSQCWGQSQLEWHVLQQNICGPQGSSQGRTPGLPGRWSRWVSRWP